MDLQKTMRARVRGLRLVVACACVLAALLCAPRTALAREYSIDRVEIDATVNVDGSLTVQELREFDFDGSFHGVYWKIPTGRYKDRIVETSILSVGEIVDGQYVEFEQSDSGAEHSYELSERSSYVQVKLYSSHVDERAQFVISYSDSNLATRYMDVSELYWKFVSDGWDVESENVTCTVHLPVPGGQEVLGGDNVRAWGHGPLDAELGFDNGNVVYRVPGVGTSEFAEARIVFPAEWLSETKIVGYSYLDTILEEEQQWADEANAKRHRVRVLTGATSAVGITLPLASLAFAIWEYVTYKRNHKPLFDDKYFRDVPSDDHPAVLGALLNNGEATNECLTASLMRLTDQGNARLDLITYKERGLLGREKVKEDFCLTALRWPDKASGKSYDARQVDLYTMDFVFNELLGLTARITDDRDMLMFGTLEKAAKKYPEAYDSAYRGWQGRISSAAQARDFFTDDKKSHGGLVIGLGVTELMLGVGSVFLLVAMGMPVWMIIAIPLLLIGVGVAMIVFGALSFKKLSSEAVELKAKLEALRRWLKDFTRLDEAIPQDVVLWNRLLVMAVVLGVSDEVIKQLRVAAPEILEDPMMMSTYGWYHDGGPSAPARAFTDAVATAHSVSSAALSSSSDSSGGGGGGGFSGGGGGGFGGGGGGGAF